MNLIIPSLYEHVLGKEFDFKEVTWTNTYQGLVRRVEHPVKFREAPQKPQTTTQTKSPQRIVIGSCFQTIISKI